MQTQRSDVAHAGRLRLASKIVRAVTPTSFLFLCARPAGILETLSTPPPPPVPPAPPSPRTGRATCLGCAIALSTGAIVAVILVVVAAQQISNSVRSDESHKSVISSVYVGDWQDVTNPTSVIQILPNGAASCHIVHGTTNYTITGGHATFDKQTKRLAIKFFFLGPSWHVDEPPHQTSDGLVMKLDGEIFRKSRNYPSPSDSKTPGVSI